MAKREKGSVAPREFLKRVAATAGAVPGAGTLTGPTKMSSGCGEAWGTGSDRLGNVTTGGMFGGVVRTFRTGIRDAPNLLPQCGHGSRPAI